MSAIRERLKAIYTPVEEAVALLRDRRRFVVGQSEDALGQHLASRPRAVIFRQLATPNHEMKRFISIARAAQLCPLAITFEGDKFVDCNPDKYALARLTFSLGSGRKGGSRNRCIAVADMNKANGRELGQVKTLWGQPLMEFHRDLLVESGMDRDLAILDSTAWFRTHGPNARDYYAEFFNLYVDRAVLFESYLLSQGQNAFTEAVIIPAFESVCARRGMRPLICRLDPPGREGDPYWNHYPPELLRFVLGRLSD